MIKTDITLINEIKQENGFTDHFMEAVQDGLFIIDPEGKILVANTTLSKITGFDNDTLIGASLPYPFWPPEFHDDFNSRFETLLEDNLKREHEVTYMHKNGDRFSVIVFLASIKNSKEESIAYLAIVQKDFKPDQLLEASDSQNSEIFSIFNYRKKYLDLILSKKIVSQLDYILDNITDGIVALDNNWCYTYINTKAGLILGREPCSLIGKHIWTEFPEGVGLPFYDIYHKALKTQKTQTIKEYYAPFDKWLENRIYPSPYGITIYFTDITEHVNNEKRLIESERYLNNILNNIGDPVFVKDDESRLIIVNDAFCKMFDLSRDDIIGKTLAEDVSPEERESFLRIDTQVLADGIENVNEESITIRNNETRIISTKKTRFIDENGTKYLVGIIRDITQRKQAEIALKANKEFSDKLIMSMQEGLLIINLEGKIMSVNDSFCNILGYSRDELIGMTLPYPFAKKEDFEEMNRTKDRVTHDGTLTFQFEFIKKNGEPFIASFSTGNVKNDKGEVIALFGTMKDITEDQQVKKALEENALESTQKKDVILKLASLVGEDYKTSLSSITKEASITLNVERVSVWSFNSCKTEIYCEKLYTNKNDLHTSGFIIKREDNPSYFKALESSQTIIVNDAQNNPITEKFAEDYLIPNKITSLMDVFIHSTDGFYGIICFEHVGEEKRNWSVDDQEFAISIASIVSLMVESYERKVAENKIIITNEQLIRANNELNQLRNQLEQENVYLRNELDLEFNYEEMVYGSTEFSNVLTEVEKVAPTNATVLLLGESGTGKELLARAIHNTSLRNKKPLIKVNCSAIPRELIESELFGHKKGSFTGAFNDKIGKFELADGGTLFLDEIGELPLDMQPKILRFLQEGEIEVVGGSTSKKLDVRVIAATNRNLKEEIAKKQFREDLYFRLNVFPIDIPPLRFRTDDIPLLVEHFVEKFNKTYDKNIKYIPDDAMNQLRSYNWPGNIRELENLIERAAILSTSNTLFIPGFETKSQKEKQLINNKDSSLDAVQRNHILHVLDQCNWKISGPNGASIMLNLKPSTLRDKMNKLDIKKPT